MEAGDCLCRCVLGVLITLVQIVFGSARVYSGYVISFCRRIRELNDG